MRKDFAFATMIGFGLGVGIALLFSPKSGNETRLLLANKTREGTGFFKDQAARLSNSAADLIDKSREEVTRYKKGLTQAVEAGKHAYQEAFS